MPRGGAGAAVQCSTSCARNAAWPHVPVYPWSPTPPPQLQGVPAGRTEFISRAWSLYTPKQVLLMPKGPTELWVPWEWSSRSLCAVLPAPSPQLDPRQAHSTGGRPCPVCRLSTDLPHTHTSSGPALVTRGERGLCQGHPPREDSHTLNANKDNEELGRIRLGLCTRAPRVPASPVSVLRASSPAACSRRAPPAGLSVHPRCSGICPCRACAPACAPASAAGSPCSAG